MNREGGPAAPLFFDPPWPSSSVFFFGLLLLFWRLDQAADVCTDKVCRHSLQTQSACLLLFFSLLSSSLLFFFNRLERLGSME